MHAVRRRSRGEPVNASAQTKLFFTKLYLLYVGWREGWDTGFVPGEKGQAGWKSNAEIVRPDLVRYSPLRHIWEIREDLDQMYLFGETFDDDFDDTQEKSPRSRGKQSSLQKHVIKRFEEICREGLGILVLKKLVEPHRLLCESLKLDRVSEKILGVGLSVSLYASEFRNSSDRDASVEWFDAARFYALALGEPEIEVRRAISHNGMLNRVGLFSVDDATTSRDTALWVEISTFVRHWVNDVMHQGAKSFDLVSREPETELCEADYPHLGNELAVFQRLLRSVSQSRLPGINILLHGPSGTGKNELARVGAAAAGLTLFKVDSKDAENQNGAMNSQDRLRSYAMAQRVLETNTSAVLLFDEVEDVIGRGHHNSMFGFLSLKSDGLHRSKAWTNELLETNPVPTIWISNSIGSMDEAWLRRFSLVLEIPVPPVSVREKIIRKKFEELRVPETLLRRLAQVEKLSPGQVAVAAKTLRIISGADGAVAESDLETILSEPLRLSCGMAKLPTLSRYADYEPLFVNCSGDSPESIIAALKKNPMARLLMSGPPGTGKTGFAHHLAEALGKPLVRKTASDLLGMYVGETEKRIAKMFAAAEKAGAVLLLDEAEGLVRNRNHAVRNWETTQVNEMLARMEEFSGVFLCSTNHRADFDPAAMRRFLFKMEFGYMRPEQGLAMLAREFGTTTDALEGRDWLLRRLCDMNTLTPADFANVRNRCTLMGTSPTATEFVTLLQSEISAKQERVEKTVGFGG
jgi:SpoVK/Ycf46/Vps4 family AAA+-type ATPase